MAEILITNRICDLESLDDIHDMDSFQMQYQNRSHIGPPILHPYRPYLHSAQPSAREQDILATLKIHGLKKEVADMAMDLGEENTIAIAEISAGLRDYGVAATGAATSVYARRMQGFGTAVTRCQEALFEYRATVKTNSVAAAAARQKYTEAHQELMKAFKNEVDIVATRMRANRATILTRPTGPWKSPGAPAG